MGKEIVEHLADCFKANGVDVRGPKDNFRPKHHNFSEGRDQSKMAGRASSAKMKRKGRKRKRKRKRKKMESKEKWKVKKRKEERKEE